MASVHQIVGYALASLVRHDQHHLPPGPHHLLLPQLLHLLWQLRAKEKAGQDEVPIATIDKSTAGPGEPGGLDLARHGQPGGQ